MVDRYIYIFLLKLLLHNVYELYNNWSCYVMLGYYIFNLSIALLKYNTLYPV